ncbi:hypothetical protein MTO96_038725 [Rhipicephalus appendiculatus]
MAALDAPMLFVVLLLVSFCKETVAPGGWTEDRTPDRPQYQAMAQFVYFKQKPHLRGDDGFTFLVTQARWKVLIGILYQLGFIIFRNDMIVEKCIATVFLPPPARPPRGAVVNKFWCR